MLKNHMLHGVLFAILAAFVNGSVGVINVFLFTQNLLPNEVAFLKSILAAIVAISIVIVRGEGKHFIQYCRQKWRLITVCAFFGFFVLYHFETAAYVSVPVAVVAFCFIGSATLVTFFLAALLQRRWLNLREGVSIIIAMFGMYCLFLADDGQEVVSEVSAIWLGMLKACIAGAGYGIFMVLAKYYKLGSGMVVIAALVSVSCLLLSLPVLSAGQLTLPHQPQVWLGLLALAVLPTIGGFWFTTKALTILPSQSVQLIELLEPVFSLIFGLIFLAQLPVGMQLIGGALVLCAIGIHELWPRKFRVNRRRVGKNGTD